MTSHRTLFLRLLVAQLVVWVVIGATSASDPPTPRSDSLAPQSATAASNSVDLSGPIPVKNSIPDGYVLVDGDIIVPESFVGEGGSVAGTFLISLWPNGVLPYEFDANVSAANRNAMISAMNGWEAVAAVDFVPRSGEVDYVHIQASTGNSSYIGFGAGGERFINIVSWDTHGTLLHELGHMLGLWHEQSRADRDQFVSINVANIDPAYIGNFGIRPEPSRDVGPYDFESVMHYHRCEFSICCAAGTYCECPQSCNAITVLPPNEAWQNQIGHSTKTAPSSGDAMGMRAMYNAAFAPVIDRLEDTPDPARLGVAVTLTAIDAMDPDGSWIEAAEFYRDADANGLLDIALDEFLGNGTQVGNDWSLTVTVTWSQGTHRYFSRVQDFSSEWSAAATTTGVVDTFNAIFYVNASSCPQAGSGTQADPYCSIQTAIIGALSGDRIEVAAGTYFETINFLGKDLQLVGVSGADTTIIDGTGANSSVVRITSGESSAAILEGFTITGGSGVSLPGSGGTIGGGIVIKNSSPTIRDCSINDNLATYGGGAVYIAGVYQVPSPPATFIRCSFLRNSLLGEYGQNGGGAYVVNASARFETCLFAHNHIELFGSGGAIKLANSNVDSVTLTLVNSTFVGNRPNAIFSFWGGFILSNCVLVDNGSLSPNSVSSVSYSCIMGQNIEGPGNINSDPQFLDAANGDYRLGPCSPARDAGSNKTVTLPTDLAGRPRITNSVVDMGAFEMDTCTPDVDTDGDLICDGCDPCPLDNPDDTDGDGVCDSADPCPLDNPDDTDGDGVCDSADPCPLDNPDDTDGDGVCDSVDPCPLDNPDDTDGDGVCDSADQCPGSDDSLDTDGDGVANGCDPCPLDNPDDTDGDGVCDSADPCPLDNPDDTDGDGVCDSIDPCPLDNPDDTDGDGVCDSVDPCPLDNPDDTDGDGVCDSADQCPGSDDSLDTDGDGVANGCDPCPLDNPDDTDGDGVCNSADQCPGFDDSLDPDGDGVADACDTCPDTPNSLNDDLDNDGLGDLCDPCPNDATNQCNQGGTGAGECTVSEECCIETVDGVISICFVADSLSEDTTISITQLTSPSDRKEVDLLVGPTSGIGLAVATYDFEPEDITFDPPVALTVTADVSDLNFTQRNNLKLYEFNDTTETFDSIGDCEVAPNPMGTCTSPCIATCTATLTHFSEYGYIAPLDSDNDEVPDDFEGVMDNCPLISNSDQTSPTNSPGEDSVGNKTRFASVVPQGSWLDVAVRVTFTNLPPPFDSLNNQTMWVGQPQEICENSGQDASVPMKECGPSPESPGDPTLFVARLQCDPYFMDWSSITQSINITSEFVIPGGTYSIQAVDQSCSLDDESSFSSPLVITNSIWGDLLKDCTTLPCGPPDGSVDIVTDVTGCLDKFRNLATGPSKARTDLEPSILDLTINISDVTFVLDAFGGSPYPFAPSTTNPCP